MDSCDAVPASRHLLCSARLAEVVRIGPFPWMGAALQAIQRSGRPGSPRRLGSSTSPQWLVTEAEEGSPAPHSARWANRGEDRTVPLVVPHWYRLLTSDASRGSTDGDGGDAGGAQGLIRQVRLSTGGRRSPIENQSPRSDDASPASPRPHSELRSLPLCMKSGYLAAIMAHVGERADRPATSQLLRRGLRLDEPPEMPDSPDQGFRGHDGVREWLINLRRTGAVHFEPRSFRTSGDLVVSSGRRAAAGRKAKLRSNGPLSWYSGFAMARFS